MSETTGKPVEEIIRPTGRKADKGRKAVEKKAQNLARLVVEYVPISSIHPNEYNPNRQSDHDFELLCRSIEEDGMTQPVIVHRDSRKIVDGEHRWRACAALGYTDIPAVFVDMTQEQMKIATLRHNRARGSEDVQLAAEVLRDLRELGALDWAVDSLMIDDVELQAMLEDIPAPDMLAGEEFNNSWVPGETDDQDMELGGGTGARSMTPEAVAKVREAEKKAAAAKTDEEKQQAKRDLDVFRLTLVFSGDEAKVVRKALGKEPARKILEWVNGGKK